MEPASSVKNSPPDPSGFGALAAFDRQVGRALIEAETLTLEQLREAKEHQARQELPLIDVLVGLGLITVDEALETASGVLNLPSIDLSSTRTDTTVLSLLPKEKALEHLAVPLFAVGGNCTLALAEPFDLERLDALQFILEREILPVFALKSDIERFLDRCYGEVPAVDPTTPALLEFDPEDAPDTFQDELAIEALENDRPLVRLANLILTSAILERATDIHLEPHETGMRVRFRVDGLLQVRPQEIPRETVAALVSRVKILAKLNISERRLPQDGKMRIRYRGRRIDVRVSTFPSIYGEKVVLRLLDKERMDFRLDRLGLSSSVVDSLKGVLSHRDGLVLVTGPTGSGKSSTLYASLRHLHEPEVNIITLEDPVEYELRGVTQTQVHPGIGFTFAAGLRSILRQDPDIILVGEIRDLETAQIALQAAQTGHLVLASLHTNDAPSAVTRLSDLGIPPYLMAASLRGVLAQRLVRSLCPSCAVKVEPTEGERKLVAHWLEQGYEFLDGEGCDECEGKGFKGRSAIAELLPIDREVAGSLAAEEGVDKIIEAATVLGYRSLWFDGLEAVAEGRTSMRELLRVAPCASDSGEASSSVATS